MSLVIPVTLDLSLAQYILSADLKLKLFSNNYQPNKNSVIASFTEVTGGGYTSKTLATASWTFTSSGLAIATYTAQTFSFTGTIGGSGSVYGYYVTDTAGTTLYWAENLPSAVSPFIPGNISYVRITPVFQVS